MEIALYRIFPRVGEVSEISLVRRAQAFDFRYFTNSWKILYARAFLEVISISLTAVWSFPLACLRYGLEVCFLLAPFAESSCIHTKFSCRAFLAVIFCISNCFKFFAYFVTVSFPSLSTNCTVPLRRNDHFLDWIHRKIQ